MPLDRRHLLLLRRRHSSAHASFILDNRRATSADCLLFVTNYDHRRLQSTSSRSLFIKMSSASSESMTCYCQRLAISLRQMFESRDRLESHYRRAIQTLTVDEYERIPKFRYCDDALACLLGRLMLRQATRRVCVGTSSHHHLILISVHWRTVE